MKLVLGLLICLKHWCLNVYHRTKSQEPLTVPLSIDMNFIAGFHWLISSPVASQLQSCEFLSFCRTLCSLIKLSTDLDRNFVFSYRQAAKATQLSVDNWSTSQEEAYTKIILHTLHTTERGSVIENLYSWCRRPCIGYPPISTTAKRYFFWFIRS